MDYWDYYDAYFIDDDIFEDEYGMYSSYYGGYYGDDGWTDEWIEEDNEEF